MFRNLLVIVLSVLVIALIFLASVDHVGATAGSLARNPKPLHAGQFMVNGEIVSIDHVLGTIQTDSYSLVGTDCVENFYTVVMLWGEIVNVSITNCPDHDILAVFDQYGKVWDF